MATIAVDAGRRQNREVEERVGKRSIEVLAERGGEVEAVGWVEPVEGGVGTRRL